MAVRFGHPDTVSRPRSPARPGVAGAAGGRPRRYRTVRGSLHSGACRTGQARHRAVAVTAAVGVGLLHRVPRRLTRRTPIRTRPA